MDGLVLFCQCGSETLAFPGTIAVSRGKEVTFLNVDLPEVSIRFPEGLVTSKGVPVDRLDLKRGRRGNLVVAKDAARGCHSYAAISTRTRSLAVGNSNPRMIVYP